MKKKKRRNKRTLVVAGLKSPRWRASRWRCGGLGGGGAPRASLALSQPSSYLKSLRTNVFVLAKFSEMMPRGGGCSRGREERIRGLVVVADDLAWTSWRRSSHGQWEQKLQ
ncbi:hypothetical protein PIB30_064560 [Stylosanthes scabra]|uniref:Uncharacterized protein n=1 Tax=Stylosanthes scabra TaxID=79078 RepID=A0ABU6QM99_9FABA|nr:hypothetical protein [Stylosanthes scabra]